MESQTSFFDLGKWHGAIIFSAADFKDFKSYLENSSAVNLHLAGVRLISADDDGKLIHRSLSDDSLSAAYSSKYKTSLNDSLVTHANMLLVMAGAYFENIIFDFFQNYFIHNPNALYDFVGEEGNRGGIKVSEIFTFDSMRDFVRELASRGAKNAGSGSPDVIFKRVSKLTKTPVPTELTSRLKTLMSQRNTIAHEVRQYSLSQINIPDVFDTLEQMLKFLGTVSRDLGLPLHDPGHLLS